MIVAQEVLDIIRSTYTKKRYFEAGMIIHASKVGITI